MVAVETTRMTRVTGKHREGAAELKTTDMRNLSLAESVKTFLDQNLDRHVTIQQLAIMFHASQTQLKSSFKDAYGVSVYSYSRAQKMKDAARLLTDTSATVLEIAGKYGYNNGSKFARAFRDVMGMSPKEYRISSRSR